MSFDINNGLVDIVHKFRLKEESKAKEEFDLWTSFADEEMLAWENSLRRALSDRIPSAMLHKLRQPRDRLFPYHNGSDNNNGDLNDSFKVLPVEEHKTPKGYAHKLGVEINSDARGYFTNIGVPTPKEATTGSWVGWADDVFLGRGRGEVTGLRSIFDKLARHKRGL